MRAFIVRPFGVKEGIDFGKVESDLIQKALDELRQSGVKIEGATTGEISRQGNIREDMFRLLVVSDLVIADVSIHNANAFYELGIRHALRSRCTLLIRSETQDKYPFDLQTDRYFLYDAANPSARVHDLAQALRETLASSGPDSPVFQLLPKLKPHGRQDLVPVPSGFVEDVDRARRERARGDLRLYAEEVQSFEWDQEGLRLVGDAQFRLRAFAGARETFELLRAAATGDLHANLRLGTIYQRLTASEPRERREELLARSDQAIARAVDTAGASWPDRAEVLALTGSNNKTLWVDSISSATPEDRAARALGSPFLDRMLGAYLEAYNLDLNAHYPGVNALSLLKAQIALAERLPNVWGEKFDDDEKAAARLAKLNTLASRLEAALTLALEMDEAIGPRIGRPSDGWAASSRADLKLLNRTNRPQRVAQEYRDALAGSDRFTLEATRRNLAIFGDLGLFEPNLSAALAVLNDLIEKADPPRSIPSRVILFTGHMVDAADRPKEKMRFPPTPKAEARARDLIERAVKEEQDLATGESLLGIAGGACGGDILFHEVCHTLGIPTQLFLALPRDKFRVTSVKRGGPAWVERYNKLCERLIPRVLQDEEPLPGWLVEKKDYDIWQRNNHWMMFNALATEAPRQTLIALYNREREPDGAGGTAHLVRESSARGFKPVELDARVLLSD